MGEGMSYRDRILNKKFDVDRRRQDDGEVERLRARVATLEEALAPFAAFNNDLRPDVKTRGACLEASDIRRAARALAKEDTP